MDRIFVSRIVHFSTVILVLWLWVFFFKRALTFKDIKIQVKYYSICDCLQNNLMS